MTGSEVGDEAGKNDVRSKRIVCVGKGVFLGLYSVLQDF